VTAPPPIRALDAPAVAALRPQLCDLLVDTVRHGASVGFLHPLGCADADAYWRRVGHAVAERRCLVLVWQAAGSGVAGSVQLDVDTLPNQPHRATVSKLLVHSSARRRGIGRALMEALEDAAAGAGRWLLTLDTATADAERLYERLGWTRAGEIPDYAMNPDGTLTPTAYYFKRLTTAARPT
jgi:ribosomal protein S18 acetylase RimI-like enzyme